MDRKDEVQAPGRQLPSGLPPDQEDDFGTVEDPIEAPTRRVDKLAWRQEGIRGLIALILLVFLGIALIGSICTVDKWSEMSELLEVWLPALTGLLGSAVGFYFGTRN
jgi:hypothetical protein